MLVQIYGRHEMKHTCSDRGEAACRLTTINGSRIRLSVIVIHREAECNVATTTIQIGSYHRIQYLGFVNTGHFTCDLLALYLRNNGQRNKGR